MVRALRLQETVFPFGVGGIADINGESFIGMDTSEWPKQSDPLRCDRLAAELGVTGFKSPPRFKAQEQSARRPSSGKEVGRYQNIGLTYMRFPQWRFCEKCGLMSTKVPTIKGVSRNVCASCNAMMVPMRFVAVCESGGHISDIPWHLWTHRRANATANRCTDRDQLVYRNKAGTGESLRDVFVSCRACGSERSFGDLSSSGALRNDGLRCFGTQPWEAFGNGKCTEKLIAVQRGSTSLYKAELMSAIDIPVAESRADKLTETVEEHYLFEALRAGRGDRQSQLLEMIADDTGVETDVILRLAMGNDDSTATVLSNLYSGEWAAFVDKIENPSVHTDDDFDVRPADRPFDVGNLSELHDMIPDIGLVHRIRKVTAQRGFRRYRQETGYVPTDLGKSHQQRWLPAIEQYGEGLFLRFDARRIAEWEARSNVAGRGRALLARSTEQLLHRPPEEARPRFILLHTLAHLLIRQLEFSAGYPAASISERIYAGSSANDPQAGVLVFTGSGDSEGTLGGLVRMAEPDLFGRILTRAIESADWCANDPICGENLTQGVNSTNFAACHSCVLLPETSCECNNTVLDRRMLIDPENNTGYFDEVIEVARNVMG